VTTSSAVAPSDQWPTAGLEQVDACPVCGGGPRSLLYEDLADRSYRCAPGRWQIFLCDTCSSAYLDPRPNAGTAHLAYTNYYDAEPVSEPQSVRGWRRLRRILRNGYLNAQYGYGLEPSSRLGPLIVPAFPRHREKADEYVRHLRLPPRQPRLLDVGCGEGEFLTEMQALGWQGDGIEPNPTAAAAARARGARVTEGAFSTDTIEAADSFDAVTFRLVLEHLRDPIAVVRACHRALRVGGVLWIATPSLDSEAHRVFSEHWIHLQAPRHAVLYTAASLTGLLRREGFEVTSVNPSRHAPWSFRLSAAIAAGLAPFEQAPPLSPRLAVAARLADLRALRRPELADVVAVVARKS
jgi:SAM-dependent methyltransferase